MANRRDKEVAKQYSSQPVPKTSSWILQKWRRPTSRSSTSTSETQNDNEKSNQGHSVHRWAIPDDESVNWSKSVVEFYNNWDSPFCYSVVFNTPTQLDKRFGGTLLGDRSHGYLTETHIQGWVGRMMNWRRRQLQEDQSLALPWTLLPPQFYTHLLESSAKHVVNYANGKLNPFPFFFEVDFVYFPFCLANNKWLHLRVDLRSQELLMYCIEPFDGEYYRRAVHPIITKIKVYFTGLLVHIQYWKKSGRTERCMTFEINEDFVRSFRDLVGNEGVYVCMLMEHLVTGKPINPTGDFNEAVASYR
ncbi:putative Ulp1 protease family catalytic domain, papain-like cysteine peptidase superfamily [Helianthus annuus]|nr:putative Ulp1 protease family catalytic domain, papain-like cysteine peptidase superfamily [Helianthus annuus]